MSDGFKVYDQFCPHFITSATVHWIPVFRTDECFRVLVDSLIYCVHNRGLLVHAYVIMPDHFHLICSQLQGQLSLVIGNLKGYTAHELIGKIRRDGRRDWMNAIQRSGDEAASLWQDGLHPAQLHTRKFFEQKMNYLHENPVRAGYVKDACDWKYSSAGLYYKDTDSIVPISGIEWPD